jgi:hypothetical protein
VSHIRPMKSTISGQTQIISRLVTIADNYVRLTARIIVSFLPRINTKILRELTPPCYSP